MNTLELKRTLAEASKRKLNLSSLSVLLHCAESECSSFTDISKLIGKTSACVSVIAGNLQDRDLVRRRSVIGGDRRTWSLELTDEGYDLLSNILNLPNQTTPTTTAIP
jgi:DNA-binding MarR family transcriptional regulator